MKEGGEEAARRLHRYLTAGASAGLPAHEITVFHGLVVAGRIDLEHGAYLTPYKHARVEFDLPDEPEPFPKTSYPNAAVLVRGLRYGPGVASLDDDRGPGLPHVQIAYEFPTEYQIDLERWFYDSKQLVDLLSIAARVPLLTRTRYVRLAKWIGEIDPNFAFYNVDSGGDASDVWPRRPRPLQGRRIDAFLACCPAAGARIRANRTPWTSPFVGWRLRSLVLVADLERKTAFSTLPSRWRCSMEARRDISSRSAPRDCLKQLLPSRYERTTRPRASIVYGRGPPVDWFFGSSVPLPAGDHSFPFVAAASYAACRKAP